MSFDHSIPSPHMEASLFAAIYLLLGFSGIILTLMVIFVKCKLFKLVYNNATYLFMVNLGVSDVAASSTVSIYAGLILLWPRAFYSGVGQRIFGFLLAVGWYTGDIFLCLVSYSRFIALTKAELVHMVFSHRKRWIYVVMPWILCTLVFSPFIYYPTLILKFFWDKVSWDYNVYESLLSKFLSYANVVVNCSCVAIQCYYNTKSFIWLRRTQQTLVTQDQKRNRDREKKLFVQCFVTCCLYATVVFMFIVLNHQILSAGDQPISMYFVFNLIWILHHSSNAIVYLILNRIQQNLQVNDILEYHKILDQMHPVDHS